MTKTGNDKSLETKNVKVNNNFFEYIYNIVQWLIDITIIISSLRNDNNLFNISSFKFGIPT